MVCCPVAVGIGVVSYPYQRHLKEGDGRKVSGKDDSERRFAEVIRLRELKHVT